MNAMKRRIALAALATIAIAATSTVISQSATAVGTTYYVDTVGCSNAYAGTSTTQPWCDFTNINGVTFPAGTTILLKSGKSWTGPLAPLGSGTSGNPITLGCYGTGCDTTYPGISGPNTSTDVLKLTNPSYWVIQNIQLTGGKNGLHFEFNQLGNQNINLYKLYIANSDQNGILFSGYNTNPQISLPANQWVIKDVDINSVSIIDSNNNGINPIVTYPNVQMESAGLPHAQRNFTIRNSVIWHAGGSAVSRVDISGCALSPTSSTTTTRRPTPRATGPRHRT